MHALGIRPEPPAALAAMSQPTAVILPDWYDFGKPEGLLAHYTKASTAFEDILPGKLRLSPYRLMRDPAENKDIEPSTVTRHGQSAIAEAWALIKAERDRMRVLSFTRDADDPGSFSGFSRRDFDCCWARPRMWEQYGDNHRGACLLFDPIRLERAICEQWPDERSRRLGNVEYKREGSAEVYKRAVNADELISAGDPAQAAANYIADNRERPFLPQERRLRYGVRVPRRARGRHRTRRVRMDRLRGLVGGCAARRARSRVAATRSVRGVLEARRQTRQDGVGDWQTTCDPGGRADQAAKRQQRHPERNRGELLGSLALGVAISPQMSRPSTAAARAGFPTAEDSRIRP
jgi:hypothetical protein